MHDLDKHQSAGEILSPERSPVCESNISFGWILLEVAAGDVGAGLKEEHPLREREVDLVDSA